MNRSTTRFATVVSVAAFSFVLLYLTAPTAMGQQGAVGVSDPSAPPPPPGTVPVPPIQKSPPSSSGDLHSFPIDVHNPGPPLSNWAGVLAKVHVLDPTEVDVTAVRLTPFSVAPFGTGKFAGGPVAASPFGAASQNVASSPMLFTAVHPNYNNSGVTLNNSDMYPVIDIDVRVKGSSPSGNSDVDLTVMVADIFHVPGSPFHRAGTGGGSTVSTYSTPGSQVWTWFQSGFAFVTSDITDVSDLHIAHVGGSTHTQGGQPIEQQDPLIEVSNFFLRRPANPDTGHWIHVDRNIRWHGLPATTFYHWTGTGPGGGSTIVSLFGSYLYAHPFATAVATLGIEHVPEPAAPALLMTGLVSLAVGFRTRRRRTRA